MKRVFFLITILLVASSVFCQQVTQQEAVKAAVNTMRYNGRTSMVESSVSNVNTRSRGDTVLLYEVVFHSGELVLLSGNKSCLPERYQSALHNVDGDVMIDGQIFNPDKCISDDGDCLRRNKYDDSKSFTYKNKDRLLVGKISTRSAYLSASTTLYTVKNNGTKLLWTSGIYVASGGNKWITCAAGDVPENILPLPDKSKRRDALCYTSVTTLTHSLTCVIIPYPASLLSSHAATKVSGASVNLAM